MSEIEAPENSRFEPKKRKSSLLKWLFWAVILACLFVFFLPRILAKSINNPSTLSWLSGQPEGRFNVGHIAFDWQHPVLLRDLTFNDNEGRPLAQVDSVTTGQSLWNLFMRPSDIVTLTLDGVKFTVVVKETKKNTSGRLRIGETVHSIQKMALPNFGRGMDVTIRNATIDFVDQQQQLIDSWTGIEAHYLAPKTPSHDMKLTAKIPASADGSQGETQLDFNINEVPDALGRQQATLKLQSDRLSVGAARNWMTEHLGPTNVLAHASGAIDFVFQREAHAGWTLNGSARFADPANPLADIQMNLQSAFHQQEDRLNVAQLEIASKDAFFKLNGTVEQLSGVQLAHLQGEVKTANDPLLDLLPLEVRNEVRLEGVRVSNLKIDGTLNPPVAAGQDLDDAAKLKQMGLVISMGVHWDKAAAYGLASEAGNVSVQYQDGVITARPENVTVNGGALRQLPQLHFTESGPVWVFPAGVMLEDVNLNEELCRRWIQLISPILAQATSANGKLSLAFEPSQFSHKHLRESQIKGTLRIRNGQVTPGPLAQQLMGQIQILERIVERTGKGPAEGASLMQISDELVHFQLKDGRVSHDRFAVTVLNAQLVTSGSVGLDDTLDMQVSVPIPAQWLENAGPVLSALKGEAIVLPVRGTISDPQVDGRPAADFGKRIGTKAAEGLLEKLLERRSRRGR